MTINELGLNNNLEFIIFFYGKDQGLQRDK